MMLFCDAVVLAVALGVIVGVFITVIGALTFLRYF